jgi:hypothetical protein
MEVKENTFPQGLAAELDFDCLEARPKPCPFTGFAVEYLTLAPAFAKLRDTACSAEC